MCLGNRKQGMQLGSMYVYIYMYVYVYIYTHTRLRDAMPDACVLNRKLAVGGARVICFHYSQEVP